MTTPKTITLLGRETAPDEGGDYEQERGPFEGLVAKLADDKKTYGLLTMTPMGSAMQLPDCVHSPICTGLFDSPQDAADELERIGREALADLKWWLA